MSSKVYVFVYGTLKKGGYAHQRFLADAEFIGRGATAGTYTMCTNGYPMIFEDKNGHPVFGELYRVDYEKIYELDRYEGYPHLYSRKIETIEVNGKQYEAWIYYNKEDLKKSCFLEVEPNIKGYLEWLVA